MKGNRALEKDRIFVLRAHVLCRGRHRPYVAKWKKSVSSFLTNASRYWSEFHTGGRCFIKKRIPRVLKRLDGGFRRYGGFKIKGPTISQDSVTSKNSLALGKTEFYLCPTVFSVVHDPEPAGAKPVEQRVLFKDAPLPAGADECVQAGWVDKIKKNFKQVRGGSALICLRVAAAVCFV